MTTKLGTPIADFETQLATAIDVAGTTATLQSATDDDGVALPAGRYFFTLDMGNSVKEHISCDLSGTSLTNIKSVSRQGVESAGVARAHRIGASVTITDYAHIKYMNDLLAGATLFNSLAKLGYDGDPGLSAGDLYYLATVDYVNGVAIAGAPDAAVLVKGIGFVSVAPASPTSPIFVGDNDPRVPTQGENNALVGDNTDIAVGTGNKYKTQTGAQKRAEVYATSTGSATNTISGNPTITIASPAVISLSSHGLVVGDAVQFTTDGALPTGITASTTYYVISAGFGANSFQISATPGGSAINTSGSQSGTHTASRPANNYTVAISPVPTSYAAPMEIEMNANFANSGAAMMNLNNLGSISIVKGLNTPLVVGDIVAGQVCKLKYDGTNFVLQNPMVPGTGFVDGSTTNVTVTNTTTETSLLSSAIAANLLQLNKAIKYRVILQASWTGNGSSLILRLKFGATTIHTFTIDPAGTPSQTGTIVLEGVIQNAGATNAQDTSVSLLASGLTDPALTASVAVGTATEDTTASKNLALTAQWENSSTSISVTMLNYVVQKIV